MLESPARTRTPATLPIPACPGESGISNHLYPSYGYGLGPSLCLSPCSFVCMEIQRAASQALLCIAWQ